MSTTAVFVWLCKFFGSNFISQKSTCDINFNFSNKLISFITMHASCHSIDNVKWIPLSISLLSSCTWFGLPYMIWSTHVIWIHWIQNKNWLFFALLPIHTKTLSFPKPINHCLPISIKATFRLSYVNVMRLVKLNPIHLIRVSLLSTFICLLSSFSHKLLSGSGGGGDEGTPMKWSRGGLVRSLQHCFQETT